MSPALNEEVVVARSSGLSSSDPPSERDPREGPARLYEVDPESIACQAAITADIWVLP